MRIAIVSKSDRFGGGASKVAEDLTSLLNQNGHFAHHYRRDLSQGYTDLSTSVYGKWEKVAKKTYYKLKYFGFQEIIPFELFHLLKEIKKNKYDIIHFHDLSSAISPLTLMYLSSRIPVVWTMHDCASFTGGCIYPLDCSNYHNGCYNCPQTTTWPLGGKFDLAFLYLRIKKYLHKKRIYLISPSQWLANLSTNNTIINQQPTVIPNGIDENTYIFLEKEKSKKDINIDVSRLTILISSAYVADPRKGFQFSVEVLKRIKHLNPYIIVIGHINSKISIYLEGFDYLTTGFISDYKELNRYYSAADIFLNTTLSDNMPLVVLESMASGTPVFGFATGGLPEMIQQHVNGYLVDNKDTILLSKEIEKAYKENRLSQQSIKAREYLEQNFTYTLFLNNHLKFYRTLL